MKNHAHPHNSADAHGSHGALRLVPTLPSEVVEVYIRQTADLSAMVDAAMTSERERHADAMRSLRAVEAALVEQIGQLADLAKQLGGDRR